MKELKSLIPDRSSFKKLKYKLIDLHNDSKISGKDIVAAHTKVFADTIANMLKLDDDSE